MHFPKVLSSVTAVLLLGASTTVNALIPIYPTPVEESPFIIRTSAFGTFDFLYVQGWHLDASTGAAALTSDRSQASVAFFNASKGIITFDLAGNEYGLFTHTAPVNLTG